MSTAFNAQAGEFPGTSITAEQYNKMTVQERIMHGLAPQVIPQSPTPESIVESKLTACPFCGEEIDLRVDGCGQEFKGEIHAFYVDCPCGLRFGPRASIRSLLHQWNRRSTSMRLKESTRTL